LNSSGSPNCALSRASASASSTTASSSVPAYAKPSRWSTITRTPTPAELAWVRLSTSPSYAFTEVLVLRATNASTCSPGPAMAAIRAATSSSSGWVTTPCRRP
jgi:hypothetical protein